MKKRLGYLALAGILSISSLASAPTISVKAATNEYMIDNEELPEGESTNKDCKVSVSVSGYFTITLPKKITLSGDSGAGDYDVTVKGNIGSLQRILVEPEKTFKLTSPGKADVETSITQPKTTFDWAEVSTVDDQSNLVGTTTTGTVTAGKLSKGRWSGTFKFNVDFYEYSVVTVEAEDTSGTNLDATAYALNKTDRTPLLESLVDEALVPEIETVNDVTAIFEIKSNEFDSEALTTFNVSAIAKDGDEVIMFKYNDAISTWELLGREVVSNNVVEGNFTSYTPFSFVVVPNESNTQNSLQAGLYLRDNTLAADWNTLNEFCLNEEGKTIEVS